MSTSKKKERLPVEKHTDERKFIHTFTFEMRVELHFGLFSCVFLERRRT